jgi:hypothetical protein
LHICFSQLKSTPYFPFIVPVFKFFAGKHIRIVIHTGVQIRYDESLSACRFSRHHSFEVGETQCWEANHAAWLPIAYLLKGEEGKKDKSIHKRGL